METHTKNNNKPTDISKNWSKDFIEKAVYLAKETSLAESCRVNDISKRVLTRWIKLIERPVKCGIYTKQFAYKSEWYNHMQAHHSQDNSMQLADKQDLRQIYLQRYNSEDAKMCEQKDFTENDAKTDFHDNLEEMNETPDNDLKETDKLGLSCAKLMLRLTS